QRHESHPAEFAGIKWRQREGVEKAGRDGEKPGEEETLHFGVRRLVAALGPGRKNKRQSAPTRSVGAHSKSRILAATVLVLLAAAARARLVAADFRRVALDGRGCFDGFADDVRL